MLTAELIEAKRDGRSISAEELRRFLREYRDGEVADYQMSAFLMATFFRGLDEEELSTLTREMIDSGRRLDFRNGGAPAVDKHSTGGVGDKVSLLLSPLVAACGLRIPMMSGRGLGHTGGTLDKLESIPGFRTRIDLDEFRRIVGEIGCAMIGQTDEITPLDGRLYALRDVTGTVPSIPLISSSIVSKKVAEGIGALVLDVKCGVGAFMSEPERALELAGTLVRLAESEGLRCTALVTGMEAPLGRTVGNALEVREAIEGLRGEGPEDLMEVTFALCVELLLAAGAAAGREEATRQLEDAIADGRALERLRRLIERQGGDPSVVDDPARLPAAPVRRTVPAPASGRVDRIDAREIGLTAVELGAGRRRMEDEVDPAVGVELPVPVGVGVEEGEPLARVHARTEEAARQAAGRIRGAIRIVPGRPRPAGSRLLYRVSREGIEPLEGAASLAG